MTDFEQILKNLKEHIGYTEPKAPKTFKYKHTLKPNDRFPFGKYKGKIIKYVYQKDKSYCLWFKSIFKGNCILPKK